MRKSNVRYLESVLSTNTRHGINTGQLNCIRVIKQKPSFLRRPTELQRRARHVKHAVRERQVQYVSRGQARPRRGGSDASTRDAWRVTLETAESCEMFVVRMSRRSAQVAPGHRADVIRRVRPRCNLVQVLQVSCSRVTTQGSKRYFGDDVSS
jgi:hypothetical protein